MQSQDTKFNPKIIVAALAAVIVAILIAFYFSYSQSNAEISFLEEEKAILVKDLTMVKAEVDKLSAMNELNEIELHDSRYKVQELMDSIGRLNFTVEKLRNFKTELRRLEAKNDSLRLKNNFLRYNNVTLLEKYDDSRKQVEELLSNSNSLAEAEALQRRKILELNKKLKTKTYLKMAHPIADGYRLRSANRVIETNKASVVEKLKGCVTVMADASEKNEEKVLYFQFLDPNKQVIEDNMSTVTVNGNIYSKKHNFIITGIETYECDFISVPEGSLMPGTYTINVFEDERLITSSEFQLK